MRVVWLLLFLSLLTPIEEAVGSRLSQCGSSLVGETDTRHRRTIMRLIAGAIQSSHEGTGTCCGSEECNPWIEGFVKQPMIQLASADSPADVWSYHDASLWDWKLATSDLR